MRRVMVVVVVMTAITNSVNHDNNKVMEPETKFRFINQWIT